MSLFKQIYHDLSGFGREMKHQVKGNWHVHDQIFGRTQCSCTKHWKRRK